MLIQNRRLRRLFLVFAGVACGFFLMEGTRTLLRAHHASVALETADSHYADLKEIFDDFSSEKAGALHETSRSFEDLADRLESSLDSLMNVGRGYRIYAAGPDRGVLDLPSRLSADWIVCSSDGIDLDARTGRIGFFSGYRIPTCDRITASSRFVLEGVQSLMPSLSALAASALTSDEQRRAAQLLVIADGVRFFARSGLIDAQSVTFLYHLSLPRVIQGTLSGNDPLKGYVPDAAMRMYPIEFPTFGGVSVDHNRG